MDTSSLEAMDKGQMRENRTQDYIFWCLKGCECIIITDRCTALCGCEIIDDGHKGCHFRAALLILLIVPQHQRVFV